MDKIKEDITKHSKSRKSTDKDPLQALGVESLGRTETTHYQSSIGEASGRECVHRSPLSSSAADKDHKPPLKVVDYQGKFSVIRDSLAKLKLTVELKFTLNSSNINKEEMSLYVLLRTSASNVKTNLKIISLLQQGEYSVEDAITDLHLVKSAHVKLLNEEHSTLFVQWHFNKDTASMFKLHK